MGDAMGGLRGGLEGGLGTAPTIAQASSAAAPPHLAAGLPADALSGLQGFVPPELAAALGFAITLLFCVMAWRRMAREWEPVMGRAVTRPRGLTGATLRFVRSGRFDAASLTASILALVSKGALSVEYEPRSVRLRKVATPVVALTKAEQAIAQGMMRTRSTLLLNQNSGPALREGAAALQDGIEAEWEGYQKGRLRKLLWPALLLAAATLFVTAAATAEPLWAAGRAIVLGIGFTLIGRFLTGVGQAASRLWQDRAMQGAVLAFNLVCMLATLGTLWVGITWNNTSSDTGAFVFAGLTLALPFWTTRWLSGSRHGAGPLKGRIEALRNHLLSKSQGIDAIGASAEPDQEPESALTLWIADAVALDAVTAPVTGQVANLSKVFEDPDRLAAVLRATMPEMPPEAYNPPPEETAASAGV